MADALGIADLLVRAQAFGIDTHHLPIRDVSVPDRLPAVVVTVERVVAAARAGKTLVIHCRGGLGRSGLVAGCCLVAMGHPARDAIRLVRAARPGAVETTEQATYVETFATSWARRAR